jgi:hypothetical protein
LKHIISLHDDSPTEEVKFAKQAIRYILDGRTGIITPSIHFSLLVNTNILSEHELQENAVLILAF